MVPADVETVDESSHHVQAYICTAPISSSLSPPTRGRSSDFGGIGGGYQVTGKLGYRLLLAADDPDEKILAATIDEQ